MEDNLNKECQELKNIKYKTMLLNGVQLKDSRNNNNSNSLLNLDNFLETEKNININEPWSKLNKTVKTKKLLEFVELYKDENNLDEEETTLLINFLKDCLDRKKLIRVKDVCYDKNNGIITSIPALHFIKSTKHFTLKNLDKRVSTLKSLAPKKTNHISTIKKKDISINDSDEEN